jgi:hypothetical protein
LPGQVVRKAGLNLAKRSHAHVFEVGLAQARFAQNFAERRLFEGVLGVLVAKVLVTLPRHLNIVEQVADVVGRQLLPMPTFNKLKQFRRVATRYDKLLANFMGFVKLAAIAIWLK